MAPAAAADTDSRAGWPEDAGTRPASALTAAQSIVIPSGTSPCTDPTLNGPWLRRSPSRETSSIRIVSTPIPETVAS